MIWFQAIYAQYESDERATIRFEEGLGFFAPDTSLGVNLRFRMQNLLMVTSESHQDLDISAIDARVRRLRLRFDGFIGKSKKLTYYLQLAFSREDQDWDNTHIPNIVRDAMVYYNFNPHFYIGLGQGKLPGNRQRIISSGQQQFLDRSLVNSIFNIDRDFGVFAYCSFGIIKIPVYLKTAITTGEGRGTLRTDKGLAYTARIEILPLGNFHRGGDFSEGDIYREPHPKLSLAAAYCFNDNSLKAFGQRGTELATGQDLQSLFADMIFKYKGWAIETEYASRLSDNLWVTSIEGDSVAIWTGAGVNTQISHYFKNGYEINARASIAIPDKKSGSPNAEQQVWTIGCVRYLNGHKVKVMGNINYRLVKSLTNGPSKGDWQLGFLAEIGI